MDLWILICLLVTLIILVITLKRKPKTRVNFQKCVFISGCDSGIGFKLAMHLDALGSTVYAGCLYPDGEGAKSLEESTRHLKVIPLDVTKEKSIYEAVNSVKEDLDGRDLWAIVNNAGVFVLGEFDWLTDKQCLNQLDVNLYGTISVTKAFLSLIRKSKGRIVNITSVSGHCTYPGVSVYCATKFGLEGFSDCLRLELAKFDIKVVIIQPGEFSRLTRLMSSHESHMNEMWNCMNQEKRTLYDGYFQKYHNKVLQYYETPTTETLESTSLLQKIEEALFSSRPASRYTVVPVSFKVFFLLLRFLPTSYADRLILFVMRVAFGADIN